VRVRAYKKGSDYSYALGVFPTLELLEARPYSVRQVILSSASSRNEGAAKIRSICKNLGVDVSVNDTKVESLAKKGNCLAVGVFSKYEMKLRDSAHHVVLVNPGDMGNLGTISRTMAAFGVHDLAIISPGVDVFDPKVIRSSMGALFHLEVEYFDSFETYGSHHQRHMLPFMLQGSHNIRELKIHENAPYSLIFGNESGGLPDEYLNMGTPVVIPHSAKVDSLNLAVAVGIALYELSLRWTSSEGRRSSVKD
jgi:TrmH family RNA methyltransferase